MSRASLAPGCRVRFTSKFLRSTGMLTGPDREFTVLGLVHGAHWAIVDEPSVTCFTPEELAADPTLAFRRIAVANLRVSS